MLNEPINASGSVVAWYESRIYNKTGTGSVWVNINRTFSLSSSADRILVKSHNYTRGTYNFSSNIVFGNKATHYSYPDGGFRRYDVANKLNINVVTNNVSQVQTPYTTNGGKFQYKVVGSSTVNEITFTGNYVNIPANTFASNTDYECKVIVTLDDGQSSTNSTWTSLTTKDDLSSCVAVSPNNSIQYGTQKFIWEHSNPKGTPQYGFDIDVKTQDGDWTRIASNVRSSVSEYDYNYNTAGTINWRVRTYNSGNVAGNWSDIRSFINKVKPTPPIISELVPGGRVILKWNSTNQIAYEIVINDISQGTFYSSNTQYKSSYLSNGTYSIKIRIINQYNEYSDFSEVQYTQNMNVPAPVIEFTKENDYIDISISNNIYSKVYVIRNGEVVGEFEDGKYKDYFVNGICDYTIRCIVAGDTFYDYKNQIEFYSINSKLITLDKNIIEINKNLDSRPTINYSIGEGVGLVKYLNKDKPTAIYNQAFKRTWNVTCNANDVVDRLGETLFYRNYAGDKAFVVITSVSLNRQYYGDVVNVVLSEIDYKESIDYDL